MALVQQEDGSYVVRPRHAGYITVPFGVSTPVDRIVSGECLGMDGPLAFGLGGAVVTALYAGTLVFLEFLPSYPPLLTCKQLINNKLDAADTTIKNKAAHRWRCHHCQRTAWFFPLLASTKLTLICGFLLLDATVYLHSSMKPSIDTAVVWLAVIAAVTYQRLLLPLLKLLIAAVADAFSDPVVNASAPLLASQLQLNASQQPSLPPILQQHWLF